MAGDRPGPAWPFSYPDLERRIKAKRTALVGILATESTPQPRALCRVRSVYPSALFSRHYGCADQPDAGQLYETATPHLIVPAAAEASRAWFNPNLNSKDFFVPESW